jgi:hypothetical protein
MRALRALISFIFGVAMALPGLALAQVTEIYKCMDPGGRPLYTSDKRDTVGKKCDLVSREINVVPATKLNPPAPRVARSSPEGFPKESASTRATAKERQRDILEKELADEQERLAQAKQELAQQESVRTADGSSYAKDQDRLQKFRDNVDLHQKNIEALKRELAR